MSNRRSKTCALLVGVLLVAAGAGAQDDLTFETTVDFSAGGKSTLEGQAGEVEIRDVAFATGFAKGGMLSSGDPEMSSVITLRLGCATTAATKWKIDILVEFLDGDGQVIDRVKNNANFKNESKTVEFNHTTLKWAVSHIKQARITVQAKGK